MDLVVIIYNFVMLERLITVSDELRQITCVMDQAF